MGESVQRRLDGCLGADERVLVGQAEGEQTCAGAILHHSTGHGSQFEGLALFDGHEVDWDIGDGYDACHGRCCLMRKLRGRRSVETLDYDYAVGCSKLGRGISDGEMVSRLHQLQCHALWEPGEVGSF